MFERTKELNIMGIPVVLSETVPEGYIEIVNPGKGFIAQFPDGSFYFRWIKEPEFMFYPVKGKANVTVERAAPASGPDTAAE